MIDQEEYGGSHRTEVSTVSLTVDNRVARITLSNPPLNVVTIEMLHAMTDAVNDIAREEAICAITLEAAPECRAFCAGLVPEEHTTDLAYQFIDALHGFARTIEFYAKPVVAIVKDAALGVGCELVTLADFVIASDKARFGFPHVKMGYFPSLATVYLPRLVGLRTASTLILTGTLISAQEAHALGLVTQVVPETELQSKANDLLTSFRRMSAPVLEVTRRALVGATGLSTADGMAHTEDVYLNQLMSLKDPGEGMIAVMEKRPPRWRHR